MGRIEPHQSPKSFFGFHFSTTDAASVVRFHNSEGRRKKEEGRGKREEEMGRAVSFSDQKEV
jgi:hypothetical protein